MQMKGIYEKYLKHDHLKVIVFVEWLFISLMNR